jgi:maltooligosyltrehalose trehalohydrolase
MSKNMDDSLTIGAKYLGNKRCRFRVWALEAEVVEVHLLFPEDRFIPLQKAPRGYHQGIAEGIASGALYRYRLDGNKERPDPASRYQPQGVHGPSQVWEDRFAWEDEEWIGPPLKDYIIYELHTGTFTPQGTFEALIPHLDALIDLGITVLELMPIAQFPGTRNWGYDGVYPFTVQNSYGGPEGLKKLVNACHQKGLAVILDVVYNHLGPEGNVLEDYGPYFSSRYRTPWGQALNFDGPHSDEVRRFFIENALYWVMDYHIDGLRLDALHVIVDNSPYPFIAELADTIHQQVGKNNRNLFLMGESALNDVRLLQPREMGGYDLDGIWNDDFHHALHALITGEKSGYYQDFGQVEHLGKALDEGFVYSGQFSAYRKRRHGSLSKAFSLERFLVFSQNHDQIGNRLQGDRLSQKISFEAAKLAAATVILSPSIPLLFMGEEYGETAPFLYFVSHSDPTLIEAVRKGRRDEFAAFGWEDDYPDPQSEETFLRSKLNPNLSASGTHRTLKAFYKELIHLRNRLKDMGLLGQSLRVLQCFEEQKILTLLYEGVSSAFLILHFGLVSLTGTFSLPPGRWLKRIDSSEVNWEGPGSLVSDFLLSLGMISIDLNPHSCLLLEKDKEP